MPVYLLVGIAVVLATIAGFIVLYILPALLGGLRGAIAAAVCGACLPWAVYGVWWVVAPWPPETRQTVITAWMFLGILSLVWLVLALIGGFIGLTVRSRRHS